MFPGFSPPPVHLPPLRAPLSHSNAPLSLSLHHSSTHRYPLSSPSSSHTQSLFLLPPEYCSKNGQSPSVSVALATSFPASLPLTASLYSNPLFQPSPPLSLTHQLPRCRLLPPPTPSSLLHFLPSHHPPRLPSNSFLNFVVPHCPSSSVTCSLIPASPLFIFFFSPTSSLFLPPVLTPSLLFLLHSDPPLKLCQCPSRSHPFPSFLLYSSKPQSLLPPSLLSPPFAPYSSSFFLLTPSLLPLLHSCIASPFPLPFSTLCH